MLILKGKIKYSPMFYFIHVSIIRTVWPELLKSLNTLTLQNKHFFNRDKIQKHCLIGMTQITQRACCISQDLDLPQTSSDYQQLDRPVRLFYVLIYYTSLHQPQWQRAQQCINCKLMISSVMYTQAYFTSCLGLQSCL